MIYTRYLTLSVLFLALSFSQACDAQQVSSAPDGFQMTLRQTTILSPEQTSEKMVNDFAKWWDGSHSYSGKAENLSLDLKKMAMFEELPDGGFVRHLEIIYFQPGKAIRLSGGLGPLQPMGVNGSLTISLKKIETGTQIDLQYNVSGAAKLSLDKLAGPVQFVLTNQLKRLKNYCNTGSPKAAADSKAADK
ncbi:MAG: ATPase [Planctomycetota bacterium]